MIFHAYHEAVKVTAGHIAARLNNIFPLVNTITESRYAAYNHKLWIYGDIRIDHVN